MTKIYTLLFSLLVIFGAQTQDEKEIFGQKISHPYAWMEDYSSPRLGAWRTKEKKRLEEQFKESDFKKFNTMLDLPGRESYRKESSLYRFELINEPNTPSILKYKNYEGESEVWTLIDTKQFMHHAFDVPSIETYEITKGDLYLVAVISHSGQDWLEYVVYDLRTRKLLDRLNGVLSGFFIFYGKGFYYERYDPPSGISSIRTNQRLAFHEFGTDQSADVNVFVNGDPSSVRKFSYSILKDSATVVVSHPLKIKNAWKRALTKFKLGKFTPKRPFFIYSSPHKITFDMIGIWEDSVYMRTDLRDPHFEVLKIHSEQVNKFSSFIPPADLVLKKATRLDEEHFGLEYHYGGRYMGVIVDHDGQVKKEFKTINGGNISFYEDTDEEAYAKYEYYLLRNNYENIDLKDLSTDFVLRSGVDRAYFWDPGKYATTEITSYKSKDGVEVPITIITNKKKFKKNGDQPTLIEVYGGYGTLDTPYFSWENYLFVKNGGVLVFPGIRGSGTNGADWGLAGRGINKQKTIDDVIAAAEYMIKEKYVKKGNVFLQGASHGGFVVAASGIQRPDLFEGIIAMVGRYDLVGALDATVGYSEINREEYGNPSDSVGFVTRFQLSPLHNLKKGVRYPSFLIITGSNDTRVPPSDSYRFMAGLREKSLNQNHFLYVTSGGHNLVNSADEYWRLMSLKFNFLYKHTGYKFWKVLGS